MKGADAPLGEPEFFQVRFVGRRELQWLDDAELVADTCASRIFGNLVRAVRLLHRDGGWSNRSVCPEDFAGMKPGAEGMARQVAEIAAVFAVSLRVDLRPQIAEPSVRVPVGAERIQLRQSLLSGDTVN